MAYHLVLHTAPLRYCPGRSRRAARWPSCCSRRFAGRVPAAGRDGALHGRAEDRRLAAWIEELSREEITSGCAANKFCPAKTSSRGEMAAFLSRAFSLP
jgi:hypothetical protein